MWLLFLVEVNIRFSKEQFLEQVHFLRKNRGCFHVHYCYTPFVLFYKEICTVEMIIFHIEWLLKFILMYPTFISKELCHHVR